MFTKRISKLSGLMINTPKPVNNNHCELLLILNLKLIFVFYSLLKKYRRHWQ